MSEDCYNLCDEWGWFVDVESPVPFYAKKKIFLKISSKLNDTNNKSDTFKKEEDNQYYYKKHASDSELNPKTYLIVKNPDYYTSTNLIKIGSATIFTVLLTYAIIFVI